MRRHRPDYWLVVIVASLLSIGLVVLYSISPALAELRGGDYVQRQIIAICLSVVAFLITSRIPLRQWQRWQVVLVALAIIGTLFALLTPAVPAYPQHRWIRFGAFSLQSVELLKFVILIAVSGFLVARIREGVITDFRKTLRPLLIAVGLIGIVVAFVQSDLGSAGVIVAMVAVMGFVAGLPMRRLLLILGIVAIGTILAVSSTPYRRERLNTYLHPETNCMTDAGHQACQALIAVGSGGVAGLGLGKGVQAYGYLPEAQNDSIFAIYAEKFGFVGTVFLLGLFLLLLMRLIRIMERTTDTYSRLVVAGVFAWLGTQAIINIGAMIGLLPLKGITLPLISYGGTSVLFVGAALGLVFQISHYTSFQPRSVERNRQRIPHEDSPDGRRIGRTHYADSSRRA